MAFMSALKKIPIFSKSATMRDELTDLIETSISEIESGFDINEGLLLEAERVTFARNFCDDIHVRCVKTMDRGSAHMVNNVIKGWGGTEIVYAKIDSKLLVDHNIFHPSEDSHHAGRTSDGGRLQDVHNILYEGRSYTIRDRNDVGEDFKREAQRAYGGDRKVNCEHDPVDRECWEDLYDEIIDEAGADPHR